MKKFFIVFVLFSSIIFSIYAEKYPFEEITYVKNIEEFYCIKKGIFEKEEYADTLEPKVTSYPCEIKKEGGYLIANKKTKDSTEKIYIFNSDRKHIIMYNSNSGETIVATELQGAIDEPWIYNAVDITASSYLTETLNGKQVSYKPENLKMQNLDKAWVEGVEGYGKGEKISFTNVGRNGSRRLYIINGFFSPEKPSLFYDNNRIKTLKINCYDREKNLVETKFIELKDTGEMQLIEFKERYKYFDFIIEDVYPGKKYDDTAITGIFIDGLDGDY